MWYWWKYRQIDEYNTIDSPETDHINIVKWSLTKEQGQHNGAKKSLHWWCCNRWMSTWVQTQTIHLLTTKVSSKWITDQNRKHETVKHLQDNIGENLDGLRFGNGFSNITSKLQFMKEIINWTLLKMKHLLCKRECQEIENTNYWLGENIYKRPIWFWTIVQNIFF